MTKVFKTTVELQNHVNKLCEKAVQNACNRLLGTLQQLIDAAYYDQFEPDYYIRSYSFWRSATTKMLSQTCGQIYMNKDAMNYNNFWTGEKQILYASQGYHGTTDIQTEGRFWDEFIEYCNNNAVSILKEELRKQGLKVK